jgi:formamidopyrimidine-DNA glycosylase
MPEWPDLHVLRGRLEAALTGRRVERVRVGDPTVIRSARAAADVLQDRRFEAVRHRGRFLVLELSGGASIVVNPMLAGLFELVPASSRLPARLPLAITVDGGTDLRYRDEKRMGKVYLVEALAPEEAVPEMAAQGPEAGELPWDDREFARRVRARGGLARNLLMDDRLMAGIGNAYADEILFEARLHPRRPVRSLSDAELGELRRAIATTLGRAVEAVEAALPAELGTKARAHLLIRGRAGERCPRCGSGIRRTRAGLNETFYCPACQPAPPGAIR